MIEINGKTGTKKASVQYRRFVCGVDLTLLTRCFCILFALFFISSCAELEKPKPEPFYSETIPPQKREFRWSNGRLPKSIDPAQAAAAPETDIVRAVYEGLTDIDSSTLETKSSVAVDWSPSDDYKVWVFKLRHDAKWSNGEPVTAGDFVRSWERLVGLGDKVAHQQLLNNISGMRPLETEELQETETEAVNVFAEESFNRNLPEIFKKPSSESASKSVAAVVTPPVEGKTPLNKQEEPKNAEKDKKPDNQKFGVEAIDDHTLKVTLVKSDKNFPALVANPIFRPIHGSGDEFEGEGLNPNIVTNGAFHIVSIGQDGITLDRSETYWNSRHVELERVRFVPTENAEKALEAYRTGEVDAVTNADFKPLALKLLTPYEDFQRTTHSALNFYEFNRKNAPFDDRRVREALAISIERERLTEDEMDGASHPALSFSPFDDDTKLKLTQDADKANRLLAEAGFANGENFPTIRLVINRNNMQQRIAKSVAKMWKDILNIDTEIVVRETSELAEIKKSGDFDLIRRGVVLATTDEAANMLTIFQPTIEVKKSSDAGQKEASRPKNSKLIDNVFNGSRTALGRSLSETLQSSELPINESETDESSVILTEAEAFLELPAIPLYFPTSYSLVKPYILGFQMNTLDAPSLKNVSIDNNWQPNKNKKES